MANLRIILVGTKSGGNVGAVARVMRNFEVEDLVLVDPPPLGDEVRGRAMHAWDVVERARRCATFEEAIQGCDFVVGTTARVPFNEKTHIRNPLDARELPPRVASMAGTVGLCFGREDFGLFNEELAKCDLTVTIPTSFRYKSLNLSHAVSILLYEFFSQARPGPVKALTPMSEEMKLTFQRHFDILIDCLNLPEHKNRGTKQVYRRLLGRAVPSAWEYFVLMGMVSGILRKYGMEIESGRWEKEFELPPELAGEAMAFLESDESANRATPRQTF